MFLNIFWFWILRRKATNINYAFISICYKFIIYSSTITSKQEQQQQQILINLDKIFSHFFVQDFRIDIIENLKYFCIMLRKVLDHEKFLKLEMFQRLVVAGIDKKIRKQRIFRNFKVRSSEKGRSMKLEPFQHFGIKSS